MNIPDVTKYANCKDCPFAKNGQPPHKPVLGEFNTTNPIAVLVGEGPGENEVRENRPFVGATGKELDIQLAKAGIPRHKTIILNATACRPPVGKTDQMLGRATKCCSGLFKHILSTSVASSSMVPDREVFEQQSIVPKNRIPTLAMGKWAAYQVCGKAQATETSRGFIREDNLLITYHPTYAFFRNPWVKGDFEIDLLRFRRLIDNKLQAPPIVVIKPTVQHLHILLESIKNNNNKVAVDIETGPAKDDEDGYTGKDPTRATLKTIALGTDTYACAFKWPIHNGVWDIVSAILCDPDITKVFHNGYFFDLRVLSRYGIKVQNISDTREIRRALVATSGLSLRYLAQTYVDFPAWKEQEDEK